MTLQSHLRVPWQNVTNNCAIPESEKRIPSFEEIKQAMLTGQGGVCYELNIFMNRLLHALGYNVNLIGGTFMGHDRYHLTNIIHDVAFKGQRHLVEVGAADPTFYPIPLDFSKESPMYQDSYLTYQYRVSQHGNSLQRWHVLDDSNTMYSDKSHFDGQARDTKLNWRLFSEMDMGTDRDVDYFTETMSYVMEALPRPLKMLEIGMFAIIYRNGRMVMIRDNHCHFETAQDTIEHRVMASMEDVLDIYSKYMPMIPQEKVLMGLQSRNIVFPYKDEISNPVSVKSIVRCRDVVISFNSGSGLEVDP